MAESFYKELRVEDIELDVQNPRIKMYLENYEVITAEGIALALNGTSSDGSFVALKESIRVNGGVINPIIVNHVGDKYVVIEGNTRVQIYKDFAVDDKSGRWATIRSIVYENLSEEEIHSIRLQSHLVGPRDWDPYSKAKYLDYLMNEARLPMNTIISYCGGKKSEIIKLVDAYRDMKLFYIPKAKELGYDVDYKDFSKFSELQNKGIIDSLKLHSFTKSDFALWVINGNIDTAQNVRLLPQILKEKVARDVFLKSNITEAYKKVNAPTLTIDLSSVNYLDLCRALQTKLDRIEYRDVLRILSPEGEAEKNTLLSLQQSIDFIIDSHEED